MKGLLEKLSGYKTHATGVLMILSALWLYRHGAATESQTTESIGLALMLIFGRAGVAKAHAEIRDLREQFQQQQQEQRRPWPIGTPGEANQPPTTPNQP